MTNNKYKNLEEDEIEKLENSNKNSTANNNLDDDTTSTDSYDFRKESPHLYYLPSNAKSNLGQSSGKVGPSPTFVSIPNSPKFTSPVLNSTSTVNTLPPFNLNDNDNNTPYSLNYQHKDNISSPNTPNLSSTTTSLPPEPINIIEINNNNYNTDNNDDDFSKNSNKTNNNTNNSNEDDNFLNTIRQINIFKFKKHRVKKQAINYLLGLFPIIEWFPKYKWKSEFKSDLAAGLTVGVMLIPQGMAYSMVAGLPPIYGLYSSIMPVIAYMIFGTSKQLSVGPFAIISLLVSETVNSVVGVDHPDMDRRISVAVLLAFVCGFIQILLGLMRFGFVANFLSDPVKTGFTSGCALIIGSSQLKHIFGYSVENTDFLLLLIARYLSEIKKTNWWAFLISFLGIACLYGIKRINSKFKIKIPGPLVVVVLFTFISWIIDLEKRANLNVVGEVPSGIPLPRFPFVTSGSNLSSSEEAPDNNWFHVVTQLLPGAFVLVLVGFISSVSIGAKFGEKYHYKIDPNQELLALGASDFFGSFFLSFPVGASLSRTAVNAQSGAVSQIASAVATIIIILSLFVLTKIIYFLPKAILSSIVIMAVVDMVEYQMAIELWKVHRKDLMLFCISFFSTIFLGILQGIIIGMAASLLLIVYYSAYPPFAVLGRLPGTEIYKNIKRVAQAETFKGIRIVRIDGSIYFANTSFIKKKLIHYEPFHSQHLNNNEDFESDDDLFNNDENEVSEPIQVIIDGGSVIGAIILDFSSVNDIDSTGIRMLKELVEDFRSREIVIYFASVKGYVRDRMKKGGVVEHYGADHFFWTINDAVEHHLYLLRHANKRSNSLKQSRNSVLINSNNRNNNIIITDDHPNSIELDTVPLTK